MQTVAHDANLNSRRRLARLLVATGSQPLGPVVFGPGDPRRGEAEALIEAAYRRCYGGAVSGHFPNLMALRNGSGAVVAAAGFRWARSEPLFLEQYLDVPIDEAVARIGPRHDREGIVEIGSLATDGGGASAALFAALAKHLEAEGATFAAATATRRLRRLFTLVNFETSQIAVADRTRLGGAADIWGAYYEHDPVVVGGGVGVCAARLRAPKELERGE
jgi:Thermostable hemolysin